MTDEMPTRTDMPLTYHKNEDGEFVCPDCTMVTRNQNTMHYHLKKHMNENEMKYKCKECDKSFLQKQSLLVHMRFKHSEKEENAYVCPFECEFSSPVKGNCVIHIIRVHFQDELQQIMFPQPDTKTVLCGACNEEFKSNSAFIYHCKRCLDLSEESEKNQALKEFL